MLFEGAAIARDSRGGGSLTSSLKGHATRHLLCAPRTMQRTTGRWSYHKPAPFTSLYMVLLDKHINNLYL
jgi:hypothetical protein